MLRQHRCTNFQSLFFKSTEKCHDSLQHEVKIRPPLLCVRSPT